ncbi:MAG TPA: DUF1223 domain-containing protein [Polyangia bacterium]|nr:DUF1223 domain-containing protein [Polyangia bacterium]
MWSRIAPLALVALSATLCNPAHAAAASWRRVVLVELFTSQGCSSCPAADAFVRDLPTLGLSRDKVVPLTFHVDYWDGLGWKDRFARPEFTARQEWYARGGRLRPPEGTAGISGLYTPQMIVDGRVHLSGGRRAEAVREMERAAERPASFDVAATSSVRGDAVDVQILVTNRVSDGRGPDWRAQVGLTTRRARTIVARGENAGSTLEEAAVVRALSERVAIPPGGDAAVRVRLTKPAEVPWSEVDIVAFAQSDKTGEVGAAVQISPTGR